VHYYYYYYYYHHLREFSLFCTRPSNKRCPSAQCAYAAKEVDKDLDIFALGTVSINCIYAPSSRQNIIIILIIIIILSLLISLNYYYCYNILFHNPNVFCSQLLCLIIFVCLFVCFLQLCAPAIYPSLYVESVNYLVMYICTVLCL
jgi:hypothetical protein